MEALLLVLWYDRAFVAPSWREIWQCRKGFYAALFAVDGLVGWLILRNVGQFKSAGFFSGAPATRWEYLRSQPGVILHYLRLTLWPDSLCLDYSWPVASSCACEILVPLALVLLLAGFDGVGNLAAAGDSLVFWAAGSSCVWAVDVESGADRRSGCRAPGCTLSLASLAVLAVVGIYEVHLHASAQRAANQRSGQSLVQPGWRFAALVGFIACVLGVLTALRNRDYQSDYTIWQDVVNKAPHNARAHINLALGLQRSGHLDEAVGEYLTALQLNPLSPQAHCNLANTLSRATQDRRSG